MTQISQPGSTSSATEPRLDASPHVSPEVQTDTSTDTSRDTSTDGLFRLDPARRGVLKAAGLVAGVGALAACSSPPVVPEQAATPAGSPTGSSSSSGSSTPATTSGTTTTATSAAAGGTPTSEIPVGGGTVYADSKTVVTQPEAGTFKAFDSTCPHKGCAVAKVADGRIDCPCHGSQFDISTGDRVAGPAEQGLAPKTITVDGDSFTIA